MLKELSLTGDIHWSVLFGRQVLASLWLVSRLSSTSFHRELEGRFQCRILGLGDPKDQKTPHLDHPKESKGFAASPYTACPKPTKLASNPQGSTCPCLLSPGTKDMCHHYPALSFLNNMLFSYSVYLLSACMCRGCTHA